MFNKWIWWGEDEFTIADAIRELTRDDRTSAPVGVFFHKDPGLKARDDIPRLPASAWGVPLRADDPRIQGELERKHHKHVAGDRARTLPTVTIWGGIWVGHSQAVVCRRFGPTQLLTATHPMSHEHSCADVQQCRALCSVVPGRDPELCVPSPGWR